MAKYFVKKNGPETMLKIPIQHNRKPLVDVGTSADTLNLFGNIAKYQRTSQEAGLNKLISPETHRFIPPEYRNTGGVTTYSWSPLTTLFHPPVGATTVKSPASAEPESVGNRE